MKGVAHDTSLSPKRNIARAPVGNARYSWRFVCPEVARATQDPYADRVADR